jgi:hypothetical protein
LLVFTIYAANPIMPTSNTLLKMSIVPISSCNPTTCRFTVRDATYSPMIAIDLPIAIMYGAFVLPLSFNIQTPTPAYPNPTTVKNAVSTYAAMYCSPMFNYKLNQDRLWNWKIKKKLNSRSLCLLSAI